MADILVRVPASEAEHFWEPIGDDEVAWWTLAAAPRDCGVGDRVWFQIGDEIVARVRITFIDRAERECESTGRTWRGVHLGWEGRAMERLSVPRQGAKLTRGFMYYEET